MDDNFKKVIATMAAGVTEDIPNTIPMDKITMGESLQIKRELCDLLMVNWDLINSEVHSLVGYDQDETDDGGVDHKLLLATQAMIFVKGITDFFKSKGLTNQDLKRGLIAAQIYYDMRGK